MKTPSIGLVSAVAALAGFVWTVPSEGAEYRLTGEYAAQLSCRSGDTVRVVYAATIREGGRLSLGPNGNLVLSGPDSEPRKGRSSLMVYGFMDLMGGGDAPVVVSGLNSARMVLGSAEGRDDLRPKQSTVRVRMARVVFRNVSLTIRNGIVSLEDCVFINSPVFIDGGVVSMKRCNLVNPEGYALKIVRSDKYPSFQARFLDIRNSTLGLDISKQTVRARRMPLVILDSNFADLSTPISYDETQHLVIGGCYFGGMKAKEAMEKAVKYPEAADRPGRIILQMVRSEPVKLAGSSLVKKGVVSLPGSGNGETTETSSGRNKGAGGK